MQAEREQLERARMQVFAQRLGAGRPPNGAPTSHVALFPAQPAAPARRE